MAKRKTKILYRDSGNKWSSGELAFIIAWRQAAPGLREPEHDKRFHPSRNWRFDFVWTDVKVAVEIEGAVYARGRHTRGSGYEKDCEKYNAALDLGYRVYRYSTTMLDRDPFSVVMQVASAVQAGKGRMFIGVDPARIEMDESALVHVCGSCRSVLQEVRPGKYQCNYCQL